MYTCNNDTNNNVTSHKVTIHKFTKHVNSEGSLGILTKFGSTLAQQGLESMAVRRAVKYALQK